MTRLPAADRYSLRQGRAAVRLRTETIAAADAGARHHRLSLRYGPDWRRILDDAWNRGLVQWARIVDERNLYPAPSDPGIGRSGVQVRPFLRPANPGLRQGGGVDGRSA